MNNSFEVNGPRYETNVEEKLNDSLEKRRMKWA